MIADVGAAALWLAASLAAAQLLLAWVALRSGRLSGDAAAALRPAAIAWGCLALLSFAALLAMFGTDDRTVRAVAAFGHADRPLGDRVATAWLNEDGAPLLLAALLGGAGALAARDCTPMDRGAIVALGAQALVAVALFTYILAGTDPYAAVAADAPDLGGLNALSAPPSHAFQLPLLFVGYACLVVAFTQGSGAIARGPGASVARAVRPWALAGWSCVTLGATVGAYEAHAALGWGGGWWREPLRDGSIAAWSAAAALAYVTSKQRRRRGLIVAAAALAFGASMLGVAALLDRLDGLPTTAGWREPIGRILLAASIAGAAAGVGAGWLARARPAAQERLWSRPSAETVERRLSRLVAPLAAALASGAGAFAADLGLGAAALLALAVAAGFAVAGVMPAWRRPRLLRSPAFWGAALARVGAAAALAGFAVAASLSDERRVDLAVGRPHRIGPFTAEAKGVTPRVVGGWSALEVPLEVRRGDAGFVLRPRTSYHGRIVGSQGDAVDVADGRLAVSTYDRGDRGPTMLALRWSPLITLVWTGGGLMTLGGVVALAGHLARERRRRRWATWA